ncbi:MAG TPA: hypothetical protein VM734_26465 [Kofleriaceae bacterium]|nr:hypothetical protein [Kofleriaceae bacterium]
MIIIWGTRHYGRVDSVEGGFAATKFAHVWFLPLVPMGSMWVTADTGEGLYGHEIPLAGKSVAAGYLRLWGPVAAVAGIVAGSLTGFAVAGVAAALCGWSWTWRSRRDPRERRRAAWHQAAFGTACDPLAMPRYMVGDLRPAAEQAFAAVSNGRTPDDVARLGASSAEQAISAYAVLRLVAASARGKAAARARAASEKILDAHRDADAGAGGGPYRADPRESAAG